MGLRKWNSCRYPLQNKEFAVQQGYGHIETHKYESKEGLSQSMLMNGIIKWKRLWRSPR